MSCAWESLRGILPLRFREETDRHRNSLQELRLRMGMPPELVCGDGRYWLRDRVTREDLNFILNGASHYSPWSAATMAQGYLTAPGGHRIGICGEAVIREGRLSTFREPTALCVRVARSFSGIAETLTELDGSILILGPPGSGKTTLLRELIRGQSDRGIHIAVVDERGELFPPGADFSPGRCTDVLTGCPKPTGILTLLRTMGPEVIAVDEITREEDCETLTQAMYCGVRLFATAHASGMEDLHRRPVYRNLTDRGIFTNAVIMRRDKSWRLERMDL